MASIEDVITGLQTAMDKIDDGATAATQAISDCDDVISQAMGMSATALANAMKAVKDSIESGASQTTATIESFKEAITRAQAAQDGT